MSTLADQLDAFLNQANESAHLEFKEAKQQFDFQKLMCYCVALANEGGGWIILGVTDKKPRQVVGTNAFQDLQDLHRRIRAKLQFHVSIEEVTHPDGRILGFNVHNRPTGMAYELDGQYWMRSGEDLVTMTQDRLRNIHFENKTNWLMETALIADSDDVIAHLNTGALFDALQIPYPSNSEFVIEKLVKLSLIHAKENAWAISKMAVLLFAKHLDEYDIGISRKAMRIIFYNGINKLETRLDRFVREGYAISFNQTIDFIFDSAPKNRVLEESIRVEIPMFPKQAIRELIANALVHQDFSVSGAGVTIEMYSNRIEISNPGKPTISIDRFIDENISRNEHFADLMRRMGLCEEKGSGIDKVITAAEVHMLPAPDFLCSDIQTTAVLYSHQAFASMSKQDRIRACYQHCCLMYVMRNRMTNQSLRNRFKLPETKTTLATQIISAALDAKLIKLDDSDSVSRRYAKYIPCWA